MKCKFCGNDEPLIEAHIIPAVFYHRIGRPGKPLVIKTNKPGQYDKKSWKGVYDSSIVCIDCERLWSEWGNYAQQLLAEQPLNGEAIYVQNRKMAYLVRDYDYTKLKLFFISMLWRASVSSQPFFSKTTLWISISKAYTFVVR